MADWTDIDVNTLLPGQPFTSFIALAFEENPRAIAASAIGSPKIARKFLSGESTDTDSTSITFTDLEPWNGLAIVSFSGNSGDEVSISFSDDGSTFVADTVISPVSFFHVDFTTGDYISVAGSAASGTIANIPSPVTDVRFTATETGETVSLTLAVELTGGDSAE